MRTVGVTVAILGIVLSSMGVATAQRGFYFTVLSGGEEVPAVTTRASGFCAFQLTPEGLNYQVFVDNLENTMQAHIHVGPAGQNGPVVLWLYPAAPPPVQIPGVTSGFIGVGTGRTLVGPLAGQPLTALVSALEAGNAYCNVHTARFGGGEIRGQIR